MAITDVPIVPGIMGRLSNWGRGDPQGRTDLDPEQGHCPGLDMCRPGRSDAGQKGRVSLPLVSQAREWGACEGPAHFCLPVLPMLFL